MLAALLDPVPQRQNTYLGKAEHLEPRRIALVGAPGR